MCIYKTIYKNLFLKYFSEFIFNYVYLFHTLGGRCKCCYVIFATHVVSYSMHNFDQLHKVRFKYWSLYSLIYDVKYIQVYK